MPATFDHQGVRFLYPENWKLEREDRTDGWTVSVQSPDTAFFLLSLHDEPDIDVILTAALDVLKAEYTDLEFDEMVDTLAGQPATGHDIRFTSLDLTNTCRTRALPTSAGTLLVLVQFNDLESEINAKVLQAICASLSLAD
jgi:hypothetical protein